ncbi:MAG: hypothetical protein K2X50_03870 [Gammaproteobacteria bacterium]|nr:hypothetical protein [Gammaproteobacteria bacterium]
MKTEFKRYLGTQILKKVALGIGIILSSQDTQTGIHNGPIMTLFKGGRM